MPAAALYFIDLDADFFDPVSPRQSCTEIYPVIKYVHEKHIDYRCSSISNRRFNLGSDEDFEFNQLD